MAAKFKLDKGTPKGRSALEAFNVDESIGADLSGFIIDKDETAPVANKASNINLAAHATILNGMQGDLVETYKQIMDESSLTGESHTASALIGSVKRGAQQDNLGVVSNMLTDPSIDDAAKLMAVRSVSDENSDLYNPSNMLSTRAVVAPTANTNEENEKTRINIGSTIQAMNAYKQRKQKAMNAAMIDRDPSMVDKLGAFFSGFIPGMSEARQANIATQFEEAQAGEHPSLTEQFKGAGGAPINLTYLKNFFMGTGSSKSKIQSQIAAMPPEKQAEAMQQLADIIINNPSPLSGLPNYAQNRADLQEALSNGGYSSRDKFVDNAFSILDLVGVLPIGAGARATKPALKAAEDAVEVSKYTKTPQFESDVEHAINSWKAAEPAPVSDLEAGLAGNIQDFQGKPAARRSKDELDQVNAIKDWKKNKPTASDIEADYKRQVNNFARRKGPKPDALENDLAAEIEAFHAKQVESNTTRDSIKSEVQPTTVSQNYKDTNVDAARASFDTVEKSATDEPAQALYGTSKSDAMGNDLLPQVGHSDGSVEAKVTFPDAISHVEEAVPSEIAMFSKHEGVSYMTRKEIAATTSWKINQVADAIEMSDRPEMFQIHSLGEAEGRTSRGFKLSRVMGPQDHGYTDANEAMELAKFTLRDSGIPDKDIKLLKRVNGEYVTTDLASEVGEKNGDYLIGIEHEYIARPEDFGKAGAGENLDVKRNFLDRRRLTDGSQGSAASMIMSRGSMLHPTIYRSALAISDKSKYLEKQILKSINDFADPFKRLPVNRQRILEDKILEANRLSQDFDYQTMAAAGMSQHEMDILRSFKKANDIQWFLENEMYAKSLSSRGYEEFIHSSSGTREPVKQLKRRSDVPKNVEVLDPATGNTQVLNSTVVDDLYARNGTVAKLLHPHTTPSGDVIEHVVVDNLQGGSYTRSIIPGQTQVLAYRPGYFKVYYKHPHVIMEKQFGPNGKLVGERAVATAESQKSADLEISRRQQASPNNQYYKRYAREHGEDAVKDEYSMAVSSGRSSWKRRGKRLEDADSNVAQISDNHIGNPVEALVRNARSLAAKTSYSDWVATTMERAIKQYGEFLPRENGMVRIPYDSREVKYRGSGTEDRSKLADARTTIDYLNYIRGTGYTNLLDKASQGAMRELADLTGAHGLARSEKLFNSLSDNSIPRALKSTAYYVYLATNPVRQFVVQSSQTMMLAAINADWVATKMLPEIFYMSLRQVGMKANNPVAKMLARGFGSEEHLADDIWKSFEQSGISSAIDATNVVGSVVADSAKSMIDASRNLKAPVRAAKGVGKFLRVVGFDAGEWTSSAASWLAHRDLALKQGIDVFDPRELENIAGHARNYTGAMNHAGDMPQNQNALSILAQFTQMAQKMTENLTTNRTIAKGVQDSLYEGVKGNVKLRQTALLMGLFGLPSAAVWNKYTSAAVANLPDNPADPGYQKLRTSLDQGLEGWSLNYILSKSFDQKVDIDFGGSLNPFNANGTAQLMYNIWTTSPGTILGKTPSGSLLFGQNPRIANFIKTVGRFSGLVDDYNDPTTFSEVAKSGAKIFSGMSNYYKFRYALEYSKKMSASMRTTDDAVTPVEAYATLFGFQTEDEKRKFSVTSTMFSDKTKKEDDFNEWYRQASVHFKTKYENIDEFDYYVKQLGEFHRVYGDDPTFKAWFDKKIRQEVKNGDAGIFTMFLRNSDLYGDKIDTLIDEYPFKDEETRKSLKAEIHALETADPTEK